MQQGGQIGLECLTVEEMFIIGQMIRECIPAESRAVPLCCNKVIHRVIHRLWTVGNAVGRVGKRDPQVLNTTAGTYILPQKKFALK
jgi:hypothetical protein